MTETTSPVSIALLNFAGTLAKRDPEGFRPQVVMLAHVGKRKKRSER